MPLGMHNVVGMSGVCKSAGVHDVVGLLGV